MISKLDAVTSQSIQKQNENEVLFLRLKYLKQITDTLKRQKLFLLETLEKSRNELAYSMQQLEEAMINQNKSKSYLISVEKSIKQTRDMSELGSASLVNIENIVKFLKVEKMYELVFEVETPTAWQDPEHVQEQQRAGTIQSLGPNVQAETINSHQSAKIKLELPASPLKKELDLQALQKSPQKPTAKQPLMKQGDASKVGQVQSMLDSLKHSADMPVQFRPKHDHSRESEGVAVSQKLTAGTKSRKETAQIVKNEEYFLEHCPVELCSILLKFIVQELCQVEVVQSVEQIPFSISRMLFLANGKSDLVVEKELFDTYLLECKKILDDEMAHLGDQIQTLSKLKDMQPVHLRNKMSVLISNEDLSGSRQAHTQDAQQLLVSPEQLSPQKKNKDPTKYNVLSMKAFDSQQLTAQQSSAQNKRQTLAHAGETTQQYEDLFSENLKLKNEIQQHQVTLVEMKQRQKDVQIGLAGEIVELQERIESLIIENEERLVANEVMFRQEVDKVKLGCSQRESQLLSQLGKIQERIYDMENINLTSNNLNPTVASADRTLQMALPLAKGTYNTFVEKAKQILEDSKNMQTHSEHLKSKKSLQSLIENIEEENEHKLQELTAKFDNFRDNVSQYIEIKESNRNTISIVFDANESNQQMINESILRLYLSKIYGIPGDKFRLLSTHNVVKEVHHFAQKVKKQPDEIVMTKILLEIVEEREKLEAKSAALRADINDGSSLLFDLLPSYVCFNLGQGGLATRNKLSQCRLLQKQGLTIDGLEYIVTLMKHKTDPFVFMAIAINMQTGEEYVLELQQKDILTLIEGDLSLLENNPESTEVQSLILNNLVLLHNDIEGQKYLSCEQKVYFNTVMQATLQSKASSTVLQQKRLEKEDKNLKKFEIGIREKPLKSSIYALSSIRDVNVTNQQVTYPQSGVNHNFHAKIRVDQEQNTDFALSVLYEAFNQIFSCLQKVSDLVEIHISIDQSAESNTLKLQFQDLRSLRRIQFCILASQVNAPLNQDSDEEGQDQVFVNEQMQDQYFVHSQCLNIDENHIVLVSVERLQNQGLSVKLHDLKLQQSSEVGLFMKSNGQMSRLAVGTTAQHQPNDQFRQMVYDLSYNNLQVEDQQQNQTIAQTYLQSEDKLLQESKDPQLAEQQLFSDVSTKRSQVNKLSSKAIVVEALKSEGNPYARHSTNIESFKQLQERGLLLFRDSQYVRVSESLATTENDKLTNAIQFSDCRAVISLCSLHIKDRTINIEVFLYNNQKISVTSSVEVEQLFVGDPRELSHCLRAKYIKQILEKLFVIEVQGRFEMKIEQDAENITDLINNYIDQNGGLPGNEDSHAATVARNRQLVQRNYEDKIREFQIEKSGFVQNGRAVMYSEYVTIGELSQVFELRIYVLLKKEKKTQKPGQKRLNTFGKTQLQIETQKLEQHIDDFCDFESIYLETADPQTKDPINILIDKKRLVQILVKDMTVDWASLVINWRQKLIPYIKHCIQIDTTNSKITLRNTSDISNLVIAHCQSICGSKISDRAEQAVIETFKDECAELLDKTLVLNQEVDFAEFSYDIKMFRISKKSQFQDAFDSMGGVVTFAYHVEVFNINEPDKVYKYRMPVSGEKSNDPVTFTSEVFNLVHHESQPIEGSTGENTQNKKPQPNNRQKQLVKRYVDNNLVIVVQQNKFPAIISLMLVEASSGLSWNCTYEPSTEITSAASFCLLEVGALEKFFNSIYDSLQPDSDRVYKPTRPVKKQLDWNTLDDSIPRDILSAQDVDHQLSISIQKHRGILRVTVYDREQRKIQMTHQEHQYIQQQQKQDGAGGAMRGDKDADDQNETKEQLMDFSDLHGAYSEDLDCQPQNFLVNKVDIRVKNVFATHLISKTLLTDQNQTALCVKLMTSQKCVQLVIQNLHTMKILFHFTLQHPEQMVTDLPTIHNISELHQARQHVYHAIRTLNTKHLAVEMVKIHNKWLQNEQEKTTNQYAISPIEKSLILHRRVFYDEQRENLIIITAEVVVDDKRYHSSSYLLPDDVTELVFRLEQPEKKTSAVVAQSLQNCVNDQTELAQLNRKDIARLKTVAKKLLDERTELKYKADDEFPYGLHFMQLGEEPDQRSMSSVTSRPIVAATL